MDNLKVQKSLCAASLLAVLSIGVPAYADGETPNMEQIMEGGDVTESDEPFGMLPELRSEEHTSELQSQR